jgi:hypothetical protein
MLKVLDSHKELIGKICKLTAFGVQLELEYEKEFGIGNHSNAKRLFDYCHSENQYEISLMFIDERPMKLNGMVFYCLKEIGKGSTGDWHWFTLNQIMLCNEFSE